MEINQKYFLFSFFVTFGDRLRVCRQLEKDNNGMMKSRGWTHERVC